MESLDYQGMEPEDRVAKLDDWCEQQSAIPYVLVGSSMGGHVAASAATGKGAAALGIFLMAPAFYMTGFEQHTPQPPKCPVTIVHGWHDDIVAWQNAACFAEPANARFVLLDDGHALTGKLADVVDEF